MVLSAIAINCTLKSSGDEASSTDAMIGVLAQKFAERGVALSETLRIADYNVLPGVTSDEGEGDDWPELRAKILAHDILVFGGPIWLGQISSLAKRVLERMDAFLSETDDKGRMPSYSKVAVAAIVGNEDGAHWSTSQLFQSLNDLGWTIPAAAACYWVGEAMGSTDFKDLDQTPEKVTQTAGMVAANAVHLAGLLKEKPYPG
ncbi:flavodoxin family protein [Pelagerythrobacter rhizovicinus]|uniref:NADPH-dependent oxidoreductase n=1 Tax=Pelagerythrobacter rhizovicinus TaxID=2268576 RepID=A0A4Q2KI40_9SPHN|nr:NAD(P)H-dependent oxidoreductase [Pelagerythrobacter rhizovicinus]RXZ63937.1 NADPH-dependent oxidoreductase [Pelagerythrobacter rhizovicinus]